MSRYFLHVKDGAELLLDPDGSDLFDLDAARMEAIEGARQLIGAAVLAGDPLGLQRAILIEDADGRTLLRVPFADAINHGEKRST